MLVKKTTLLPVMFFAAFIPAEKLSAQIVSNIKEFFTPPADTNFIKDYSRTLITRVYLSDKLQSLKISSPFNDAEVKYKPNNKYSLGVGLTYRFVTLNIGFGIGSQDPNKGKTSSLDLQTNIYRKDWSIDLLLQSYKGYYIDSKGYVPGTPGYYSNRDLRTLLLGGGAWRMLNEKKFSYKATMTQSQWQQKSSGSFVVGGIIYYGSINANGNMIPDKVVDSFPQKNVQKIRFTKFGPGVGYAYTYVYKKNYFITAGLNGVLEFGLSKELYVDKNNDATQFSIIPNLSYRIGVGYNSKKWILNLTNVSTTEKIRGASTTEKYNIHSGNWRITWAYRFTPGRKTKKYLKPVDKTMDNIQDKLEVH